MLRSARSCASALALALFMAPGGLFAGPAKVPARLAQARYVALAYDLGGSTLSESEALSRPGRVIPEDRAALHAVRSQLEKWGRYVITVSPAEAELLVTVRTGTRASVEAGVRIGGRRDGSAPARSAATGSSLGVAASSGEDVLSVYDATGGGTLVLWRGQRRGGLAGPSPSLFEDLKADVERAAHP